MRNHNLDTLLGIIILAFMTAASWSYYKYVVAHAYGIALS